MESMNLTIRGEIYQFTYLEVYKIFEKYSSPIFFGKSRKFLLSLVAHPIRVVPSSPPMALKTFHFSIKCRTSKKILSKGINFHIP